MAPGLKISRIGIYKMFIPLKEPFVISLGPIHNAENVIVVIETEQGLTGFGECSPFASINGEFAETGMMIGKYFAKALIGKDPLKIAEHITAMDQIIYGNNSIKSAFDMALYDIASQNAGVPLFEFIGGRNNTVIVTDYTVSIGEPEKMAADALAIKEQGYPAIKVKLGKDGRKDVERIKAIRMAVGPTIPIRIDANQGWNLEEAKRTLTALAEFSIQHCEEPIPRWAFMHLPELRKQSPIKIMSDESCGDDHDVQRLIELGACDYMNIKLGKSGGIYRGLKMVRLAEQASIHLQVGAFMESRLAMTAFAHFSLCSPVIEHYDFDTSLMFSDDPVIGGIQYQANGVIDLPAGIGLGATISSDRLKSLEKIIVE